MIYNIWLDDVRACIALNQHAVVGLVESERYSPPYAPILKFPKPTGININMMPFVLGQYLHISPSVEYIYTNCILYRRHENSAARVPRI